jgi:transposase
MSKDTSRSKGKVVQMGIDTSKHYFQLQGVDKQRKVILRKRVTRAQILSVLANMPKCTIGIEFCGSSHYWYRKFSALGHTVKILPAKHVKAFVLNQKNDSRDASAICEALNRPDIHPVAPKSIEQQDVRRGKNKATVAAANKLARIAWVIVAKGVEYNDCRHKKQTTEVVVAN